MSPWKTVVDCEIKGCLGPGAICHKSTLWSPFRHIFPFRSQSDNSILAFSRFSNLFFLTLFRSNLLVYVIFCKKAEKHLLVRELMFEQKASVDLFISVDLSHSYLYDECIIAKISACSCKVICALGCLKKLFNVIDKHNVNDVYCFKCVQSPCGYTENSRMMEKGAKTIVTPSWFSIERNISPNNFVVAFVAVS